MQISCQQVTTQTKDRNTLILLPQHKPPSLVKHQFSVSLTGALYHVYFDFKKQKLLIQQRYEYLYSFPELINYVNYQTLCPYTGCFFIQMPQLY